MMAIRDLVESSQTPLIGSNASPTGLQGVRYIWRTSYIDDEPAKALGRYLSGKVGGGSVAVVASDNQQGRDEVKGFLESFAGGRASIAGSPTYTPVTSNASFGPQLATIRTLNADAVFCSYVGSQAIDFVKQYRQAGLSQPLYAPGFLTEGKALTQEADAARGVFTSMNYSPDLDNDANRRFAAAYQQTFDGVATAYAMASYDAAFVLDKAIESAGAQAAPQTINLAIGKIGSIDSPRGSWQFNQNRTPLQKWYLRQVRRDGSALSNVVLSELTTLG
jgi:branched-chain amino acid transport system substrate-binding protein